MAKIIKVNVRRVFNTGNYQSLAIDLGLEKQVEDDTDVKEEYNKLIDGLDNFIRNKAQNMVR